MMSFIMISIRSIGSCSGLDCGILGLDYLPLVFQLEITVFCRTGTRTSREESPWTR